MFCAKCGTKAGPEAKFCSSCGAPLDQVDVTHQQAQAQEASSTVIPGAPAREEQVAAPGSTWGIKQWLSVAFLMFCVGVLVFKYSSESGKQSTHAAESKSDARQRQQDSVELKNRCISQAKSQGYRSGQCAYSFIDTCIRTQSRKKMEEVLRTDSALGMGTAFSCPNMPSTYEAEFDRF